VAKLKITLKRSMCNIKPNQVATIKALGLRKPGSCVEHEDTPQIRGMIKSVEHLVSVEEV